MSAELVSSFHYKMYEPSPVSDSLRTGDVVCLTTDDFKSVVKYPEMLALLHQFEKDPNYRKCYWAVLNQPCDMVHDDKGRRFKSNLFLVPLLGLKSALKKGVLGEVVHFETVRLPEKVFLEEYAKFQRDLARQQNPKLDNEDSKSHSIKVNSIVDPGLRRLEEDLAPVKGKFSDPNQVLEVMLTYAKDSQTVTESLESFKTSPGWLKALAQYKEQRINAEKVNDLLILKADSESKLSSLFLNQRDSQGLFYYEPHPKLSAPEFDLSYVIVIQDMLTIKINVDVQEEGTLFRLLLSKRVVSLTENFSDRLLNIMGNYFSKIGTDDVEISSIFDMYKNTYPESFFLNKASYESQGSAKK